MSTPQHCPGFENFKNLQSFTCKCDKCNATLEIFSDEFDKPHKCKACGAEINFAECTLEAGT